MQHITLEGFNASRTRLDDIKFIYEFLNSLNKFGLNIVSQPFILPYYNGVVPEDCGISAFVFLLGGHFTIHTFSYREVFFVDCVCPELNNLVPSLISDIPTLFLTKDYSSDAVSRNIYTGGDALEININSETTDFGPHLFMNFKSEVCLNAEETIRNFDDMPFSIGMTPIMRPYFVETRGKSISNNLLSVKSIITMIAESHISLHSFVYSDKPAEHYFDLFSCKFFDYEKVIPEIEKYLEPTNKNGKLISRGINYMTRRKELKDVKTNNEWIKYLK